jgi:hypothetical protein
LIRDVLQPLRFLKGYVKKVEELYNTKIINNYLTRDVHTHLHEYFQNILDKLKVITSRLNNLYDNKLIWAIANGYSHVQNFHFGYHYEGGVSMCEYCDAPPIYIGGQTFDPEEAYDKKIEMINIYLPKQSKSGAGNDLDYFIFEINSFLVILKQMIDDLEIRYSDCS